MSNNVYYRPYFSQRTGKITVVCLQDFDLDGYILKNFVSDTKFDTEQEAKDWCIDNYDFCKKFITERSIFDF